MVDDRGTLQLHAWIDGKRVLIPGHTDVDLTVAHNAEGTCTVGWSLDSPYLGELMSNGSVLTVTHQPSGRQWFSGVHTDRAVHLPDNGSVKVTWTGDLTILREAICLPNPTRPLSDQQTDAWRRTGPAETVVKALIREQLPAQRIPLTVAPDKGRGSTVTIEARLTPVWDEVVDRATAAGLGIRMGRDAAGKLTVDVYEPAADIFPVPIRAAGGVLEKADWSTTRPKATRVVVGGYGDGAARQLLLVEHAAAIAEWGAITAFEDYPNATATTTGDDLALYGLQQLLTSIATTSLDLTLSGVGVWSYGPGGLELGTTVSLDLLPTLVAPYRDVLTSVHATHTPADGLVVTMGVGASAGTDPDIRLARYVRTLDAALQRLRTS